MASFGCDFFFHSKSVHFKDRTLFRFKPDEFGNSETVPDPQVHTLSLHSRMDLKAYIFYRIEKIKRFMKKSLRKKLNPVKSVICKRKLFCVFKSWNNF